MGLYIQYGCGLSSPEGWTNFDVSPGLVLRHVPVVGSFLTSVPWPATVRYGDIRKGLPVEDSTADGVYCSHVLEHLSLKDLRMAIRNTYRVVKPGGSFRLVVPDLKFFAKEYLNRAEPDAAIKFMESTLLGRPSRPRGLSGLLRSWLGNAEHLWMWDYEALSKELTDAGFTSIRRAQFGDAGDLNFSKVEDPNRWKDALGIHCNRPAA